ncbi:MAG: sulfatase [Planctomycetota bacterium]
MKKHLATFLLMLTGGLAGCRPGELPSAGLVRLDPQAGTWSELRDEGSSLPDPDLATLGDGETRWVVRLVPPCWVELPDLTLPSWPKLSLGLAYLSAHARQGQRARLALIVTSQRQRETVAELVLDAAPSPEKAAWSDHVISLERWGANEVTLEVVLSLERGRPDPEDVVLLGSPLLHSALRATEEAAARPNLLLVSLGSLRADRVGAYGYPRATTPCLDELAAGGTLVESAHAPGSQSLTTLASLLTGQFPQTHGLEHDDAVLSATASPSLAEILARAGYVTLAATGGALDPRQGLARGFDIYTTADPFCAGKTPTLGAPEAQRLLERLESLAGCPLFIFLHSSGIEHYSPLPEDRAPLMSVLDDEVEQRCRRLLGQSDPDPSLLGPEGASVLSDLYDGAVRGTDRALGAFLGELDRRGLLAHTLVVLTSDHGVELLDHGGLRDGRTLYEEQLRVPLVLSGARVPAGMRVAGPFRHVDLAPTLLALLDLSSDGRLQGRNLAPVLTGGQAPESTLIASLELGDRRLDCLQRNRFKLVRCRERYEEGDRLFFRLHDLEADPSERVDFGERLPDVLARLADQMERMEETQYRQRVALQRADSDRYHAKALWLQHHLESFGLPR